MKPSFYKVRERNTREGIDLIHIESPAMIGNVTLCGKTDWIGENHQDIDEDVNGAVNCPACKSIIEFVYAHRKPVLR